MGCFRHDFTTTTLGSPMRGDDAFKPAALKAKEAWTKIKPHGMRDSVRVDPEHVWGDEGPVNE